MTNHPHRSKARFYVENDAGDVCSKSLPREEALTVCRKLNNIPAGQPRSGTYRVVPYNDVKPE